MLPTIKSLFSNDGLSASRLPLAFVGILLILGLLATLPLSFNQTLEDALVDVQFKLRGERILAEQFAVVFIGAEDIRALGGWPLTRDYYGYLMHILTARGAKVIGLDLLLDAPQWRYPEYDSVLADFFAQFENDCLPLTFAELAPTTRLFHGELPTQSWKQFRKHLGGEGFSNFEREPSALRVPIVAAHKDTLISSFGYELARLFLGSEKKHASDLPLDTHGRLRLNHFGEVHALQAMSLVELLQIYAAHPDSLRFDDKLVLVAVVDPSLCTFKSTPLAASLPASFIHLTVAENIIQQNYLRELGTAGKLFILAGLVTTLWLISKLQKQKYFWALGIGTLLVYWIAAALFFQHAHFILPLFYPSLAAVSCLSYAFYQRHRTQREHLAAQQRLLEQAILAKEEQLEAADMARAHLQEEWRLELREQTTLSQTRQQQLLAQQQQIHALEKQLSDLRAYAAPAAAEELKPFAEIIHAPTSPMAHALALVAKVGKDDIPVLIQGETGTGKELLARALHQESSRHAAPFVAVNCAALPETLLESELFGHEKGSFTGAQSRRRGRFELAKAGTIFLDEIGETSLAFQARLLRILQEGTYERVGGEESLRTEARVLAASNRDLQREVEEKRFRADLFYRLNGVVITLPPLRERSIDLPLLLRHFLRKHGMATLSGFSEDAMAALQSYAWPGNVRELENVVRRAALFAQSAQRTLIRREDLPPEILTPPTHQSALRVYESLPEQILQSLRALQFSRAAISQTAKALGNRDRGTITEYLRGMCFESFVQAEYDTMRAAQLLAGTDEREVVERVRIKLEEYVTNLRSALEASAQCKGLPKKYHAFAEAIWARFNTRA